MVGESKKSRRLGFITGFITGGLVGAAATVIYERRAQIPSVEAARERGSAMLREAGALAGRAAGSIEDLSERTRPLIEKTQQACAEAVQDGRARVARTVAGLQRRQQEPRSEAA